MTWMRNIRSSGAIVLALLVTLGAATIAGSRSDNTSAACREKKVARAELHNAEGTRIGVADFWADSACVARVTVKIGSFNLDGDESGLTEGFHGFHIHDAGTCDRNAEDAAGNPSPFFTAGAHWNPDERIHGNHRGDLPPLLATTGGLARANILTDRFTINRLLDENGSAVIVHQDPDNLAHVLGETAEGEERYHSHVSDGMGPDPATLATGDGGSRFACGVVKRIQK